MSTTVQAEIAKLRAQVDRDLSRDTRGRKADAAAHLRQAIVILEGALQPTDPVERVVELLVEAADLLVGKAGS